MMRVLLTLLPLAACAPMPEAGDMPAEPPAADAGVRCDADRAGTLVGQTATAELGAEALRLTGSRTLRWLPPGAIVTMDFRPDRLNVTLDAENRVTAFRCG